MTTDKDILEEALEITKGDRQNAYGPPDQDFRRTAGMWSALFEDMLKPGVKFKPFHVAQAMILIKMSRQLHQRKKDNWADAAGYARCGWLCDEAEKNQALAEMVQDNQDMGLYDTAENPLRKE